MGLDDRVLAFLVAGELEAKAAAGATEDEISETLMYAMRGAARATWSTPLASTTASTSPSGAK